MSEDTKKISFGFTKPLKTLKIIRNVPEKDEKKVELIECFEGQNIKIKNAVIEEPKAPLVIPLNDSKKNLMDRVKEAKANRYKNDKLPSGIIDVRPDSELTLDELAARQLIEEAKKEKTSDGVTKVHVLPAVDNLVLEGSTQSTLEDYENVPIVDFGMAVLRGMGWSEQNGIGRNNANKPQVPIPELRPKGLGLGANKMLKKELSQNTIKKDEDGKELGLAKEAFAKIIAGNEKGNYCVVKGFDEESGRVIVKTAILGTVLSLNEFLLVPVTRTEYEKSSRILNNDAFNKYKEGAVNAIMKEKSSNSNKSENTKNISKLSQFNNSDKDSHKRRSNDTAHSHTSKNRDYSSGDDRKKSRTRKKDNSTSEDSSDGKNRKEKSQRSRSRDKKYRHRSSSSESSNSGRYRKKKSRQRSTSSDNRRRRHRSSSNESDGYRNKHKKSKHSSSKSRKKSSQDKHRHK